MAGLGVAAALGGDGPVRAVGAGVPPGLVRALGGRAVQRGGGAPGPQEQPGLRRAAQALLPPHLRRSVPVGVGGGGGEGGAAPCRPGGGENATPCSLFPFSFPFFPLPWVCPGCLRLFPSAPWGLGSWASPRGAAKQKVREMGVCKASSPRLGSVKLPCLCLPGACTWSSRSSFSRGKVLCKLSRY